MPRDAAKPKLWVCQLYNPVLTPDTKIVMDAMCEKYGRAQASENARDALAWSTNLVSDKRYRLCPDGCGLVFMSRHNVAITTSSTSSASVIPRLRSPS